MSKPTHSQIATLAYQLYLEDGKPQGEAESHWHRAMEILSHPETYSDDNILAPPSEPEITPALDEKAQVLDGGLPSDPHSGSNAYHQRIELAVGSKDKKAVARLENTLRRFRGIERLQHGGEGETATVQIFFDARRTNPAAIHEALAQAQVTDRYDRPQEKDKEEDEGE